MYRCPVKIVANDGESYAHDGASASVRHRGFCWLTKSIETVGAEALRPKATDVSLQFRDLTLQTAAVRLVLLRVDRFLLECRVILAEGIYLPSQLLVLRVEVVGHAPHVIVSRRPCLAAGFCVTGDAVGVRVIPAAGGCL